MATRIGELSGSSRAASSGDVSAREHGDRAQGGVVATTKRLVSEFMADDVLGIAAEMSYRFLLALFPLFIFFAALAGFVANATGMEDPTQELMNRIGDALPADAASTLEGQLRNVLESQSGGLMSIGILAALWGGSGAMKAIMKGMNRAYDVEEQRGFFRKNAVGLGLTVLLGLAVIAGFTALVVGQFAGEAIADRLGMGSAFSTFVDIVRWPLALLLLIAASAFLYWAAPNAGLPFRWVSPGAVLFVVGWIVATALFGLYVSNFGSYANTYGALAGVIILLLWLYITSIAMLLGAELNAVLQRQKEPQSLEGSRHGQSRGDGASAQSGDNGRTRSRDGYAGDLQPAKREPVDRTAGALGLAVTAVAGYRAFAQRDGAEADREARV